MPSSIGRRACPALGIVAAVLGVIHTMGSITEPPEVLGQLIGARAGRHVLRHADVLRRGRADRWRRSRRADNADAKYFHCMKAGLLAHMQGYPPAVSVEFARKVLMVDVTRPSFYEVEASGQRAADAVTDLIAQDRVWPWRMKDQSSSSGSRRSRRRPSWRRLEGGLCRLRDRDDGLLPAAVAARQHDR